MKRSYFFRLNVYFRKMYVLRQFFLNKTDMVSDWNKMPLKSNSEKPVWIPKYMCQYCCIINHFQSNSQWICFRIDGKVSFSFEFLTSSTTFCKSKKNYYDTQIVKSLVKLICWRKIVLKIANYSSMTFRTCQKYMLQN